MAIKNRHQPEDIFTGIENGLKDQLVEIFLLRKLRDEQNLTISELRDEIEQLKRELDSKNAKGSIILKNNNDESTQVLDREFSRTRIGRNDNEYGDDRTEILTDKVNKPGKFYGTQIINSDEL